MESISDISKIFEQFKKSNPTVVSATLEYEKIHEAANQKRQAAIKKANEEMRREIDPHFKNMDKIVYDEWQKFKREQGLNIAI